MVGPNIASVLSPGRRAGPPLPASHRTGRRSVPGPVWIALALLVACSSSNPARQGAEDFVDRYYVGVDPAAAREYAVGFARGKLDRELRLLEEVEMAEMSARPIVHYRLLEERPGSDERHRGFLFELTIRFAEGGSIERKALVTVREEGDGRWKTANFQELD